MVGAKRFVASDNVAGIDFSKVHGMFTTGNKVYWATPTGALNAMDWAQGPLSGFPVPGTATQVSGPGVDTVTWNGRALFLYQDANGARSRPAADGGVRLLVHQPHLCLRRLGVDDLDRHDQLLRLGLRRRQQRHRNQAVAHVRRRRRLPGDPDDHHQPERGRLGHEDGDRATAEPGATGRVQPELHGHGVRVRRRRLRRPGRHDRLVRLDFGDGATATGVSPTHDYGTEGPRTVTLTVTDNDNATGTVNKQVNVTTAALQVVDANSTNGNRTSHSVAVPAGARPATRWWPS